MRARDNLLAFFRQHISEPVSYRELCERLKVRGGERKSFKKLLRSLVDAGDIIRSRRGLYGLPNESSLLTGYFEAHRDGYGFVVPEMPGLRDVFVAARNTMGAMDNDRVVVRLDDERRRSGSIVRILHRSHTRIVGTFHTNRHKSYVVPKNRSIPFDLTIIPDGRRKAQDGDVVLAEITSFSSGKRSPEGKVLKVIAQPESPRDELEALIDEYHLPRRFPHEVCEEAHRLYAQYHQKADEDTDILQRKDLSNLATFTIDGERARDFDDAVSIAKTDDGYCLWVHIADVGFFVPWDCAIDLEARRRGTSVYFPDRVIAMLPKELSEDLCSLKPRVFRRAITVEMLFDEYGNRTGQRFYPSIIRSNERMTYTAVKKIVIDHDEKERNRYEAFLPDFELMADLCHHLKEIRIKRGSLDFDLPEPEIIVDMQGNPESIIRAERNFAHMIIEEFMIAANEAVAEYLQQRGIPTLYRIHEEPDPIKFEEIIKTLQSQGFIPHHRVIVPQDVSGLLKHLAGRPEESVLHAIILRSLKQARYCPVNIGHFGLASKCYTHFTSPIRRYPDLVTHRILRELIMKKRLSDKRIEQLTALLPEIAFQTSRAERHAVDAERAALEALRVWYMKDKEGSSFTGTIVAVTPFGLKVRFDDVYVEGFLHVSAITDDYYRYDEHRMCLVGVNTGKCYGIGQKLTVRIAKIDMMHREILLHL